HPPPPPSSYPLSLQRRSSDLSIDGVVNPPGAVNLPVIHMFVATIILDRFHYFLDVLNLIFVSDQQGIFCFDDHQVLHAYGGYQPAVGPNQSGLGIMGNDIAGETVAV